MLAFYISIIDNPNDKEKFTSLYEKYKDHMYKVAFSILRNNENAEDAVQNSFLRIIKNFSLFDNVFCEKTRRLIVIISKQCAIEIYRKVKTASEFSENIEPDFDIASEYNLENDVLSNANRERIYNFIKNLPATYKDVIRLRFVEDYSNDEIAKILGITKTNVETRVTRGKAMLASAISREESL
ncbi:hypothetical protein FACS1894120_5020 [Clostridia bacterium]|nr:hypothetical protein FACS1894120_5020 [Clostridia bacterium]